MRELTVDYGILEEHPKHIEERFIQFDRRKSETQIRLIAGYPDFLKEDFYIVPLAPFEFAIKFYKTVDFHYFYEDKFWVNNTTYKWTIQKKETFYVSEIERSVLLPDRAYLKTFVDVDSAREYLDKEIERIEKQKAFMAIEPVKYERKAKNCS